MKNKEKNNPKCKECGSTNFYTNKDKTRVCRHCGFREKVNG